MDISTFAKALILFAAAIAGWSINWAFLSYLEEKYKKPFNVLSRAILIFFTVVPFGFLAAVIIAELIRGAITFIIGMITLLLTGRLNEEEQDNER